MFFSTFIHLTSTLRNVTFYLTLFSYCGPWFPSQTLFSHCFCLIVNINQENCFCNGLLATVHKIFNIVVWLNRLLASHINVDVCIYEHCGMGGVSSVCFWGRIIWIKGNSCLWENILARLVVVLLLHLIVSKGISIIIIVIIIIIIISG